MRVVSLGEKIKNQNKSLKWSKKKKVLNLKQ